MGWRGVEWNGAAWSRAVEWNVDWSCHSSLELELVQHGLHCAWLRKKRNWSGVAWRGVEYLSELE